METMTPEQKLEAIAARMAGEYDNAQLKKLGDLSTFVDDDVQIILEWPSPNNEKKIIVAEISKNWERSTPATGLLCERFEYVISVNLSRGYELAEWKMKDFVYNGIVNETIIAIFKKA